MFLALRPVPGRNDSPSTLVGPVSQTERVNHGVPLGAWDQASSHYDRQLWLERSAVRTALDMLDPQADERLLDIGTGTGEVLRQLLDRDKPPHVAVGVDASAGMLAHAPKLPPEWAIREGDARELPFDDDGFDIAVAAYILHVLPAADVPTALAELARVLRPGGRAAIVTPAIPRRGVMRCVALASDALARRAPRRYGGLRALDPRSPLSHAGFTVVNARTNLRGYPSLCVLARSGAP